MVSPLPPLPSLHLLLAPSDMFCGNRPPFNTSSGKKTEQNKTNKQTYKKKKTTRLRLSYLASWNRWIKGSLWRQRRLLPAATAASRVAASVCPPPPSPRLPPELHVSLPVCVRLSGATAPTACLQSPPRGEDVRRNKSRRSSKRG